MQAEPGTRDRSKPTVFTALSTHKLLAALSQASNDVSAAMMEGSGEKLTGDPNREAIAFRQMIAA